MLGEQAFGEILRAGVDVAVRICEVAQEAVTDPLVRGGENLFRSWDRGQSRLYPCSAQQAFDSELRSRCGENHVGAAASCPSGSSASVREHVGVVRKVHLNDPADVLYVQPTRRYVGGHQVPHGAATKLHERGGSLALRHLSIECTRRKSGCAKLVGESDGFCSCAYEQQGLVFGVAKQHVDRCIESIGLANAHHDVLDVGVGLAERRSLYRDGILLKPVRQSHDLARERRGDQVCPAYFGREPEDAVELFLEIHVQHLIGFVERDGLELFERHRACAQMVEEAARRADDDLGEGLQLRALLHDARSASDHEDARSERRVEPSQLAAELSRQLAGRCDQESHGGGDRTLTSLSRARGSGRGGNRDGRREEESEGDSLARPRLGGDAQVPIRQLGVQNGLLDGGELLESGFAQSGAEARRGLL